MKPEDYLALEVWGKSYLTPPEIILKQQQHAARDGAPVDVIRRHNGKWVRVTSLPADDPMRRNYEKALARSKTGVTASNRSPRQRPKPQPVDDDDLI